MHIDDSVKAIFLQKLREAYPGNTELALPEGDPTVSELWNSFLAQLETTDEVLTDKLAELTSVPMADSLDVQAPELLPRLPYSIAHGLCAIPQRVENEKPVVVIANPFDQTLLQTLRFAFGVNHQVELAPPRRIQLAIEQHYAPQETSSTAAEPRKTERLSLGENNLDEREIPRLARKLLLRAISSKASDIHIQPVLDNAVVRIRVDGSLVRLSNLSSSVAEALVRFFKALGGMDPTNNRIAQDGRVGITVHSQPFDLRMSSLPVAGNAEKLVIRLLRQDKILDLAGSGLSLYAIRRLRQLARSPSGVVLICGPTGSGKTSTLYSMLAEINSEDISIATVENPVEYQLPGASQTDINLKAGLSFASALRAILRQDPDVVLLGEIRDDETAQIAMQAALTGHLVLSTLHTNSSVGAISRLADLGVSPVIMGQALTGIASQRLLRKLCSECADTSNTQRSPSAVVFKEITGVLPGATAVGCEACHNTGYKGRVAVTEILEINAAQAEQISRGESTPEALLRHAPDSYRPISSAAARRVISGETSPEEATRVLGRQFWLDIANEYQAKLPDLGNFAESRSGAAGNEERLGVLLTGDEDSYPGELKARLEEGWLEATYADGPEQAREQLQDGDRIAIVVVDIPEGLSDDDALELVAHYRVSMAWSRLPALILLPAGRSSLQQTLVDAGATSRFMEKPVDTGALIELILSALATDADYRWGLDTS